MTRWLTVTLLVLWSGPAFGDWVPLGGDPKAGLTIYADTRTKSDPAKPKTVLILYDFKTGQGKGEDGSYLSVMVQREYDCAQERRRLLDITHYAEPMGTGEVVLTNRFSPPPWVPVTPLQAGTMANELWTLACHAP